MIGLGQNGQREVSLLVKHGVEAKNYDDIGKAEKLKPLEVGYFKIWYYNLFYQIELRRLEDLSDSIVKDFAFMRQREEEMRNTNGWLCLYFEEMFYRVHEYQSIVPLNFLHACATRSGRMAGYVP